ncbi:PEP-CTERM sorting domain-containing protein [Alkalimonas collagenimarina]|uniref:PEP-CTERM sorting domain-containing protein n=1 Tax=Alkalimonas collagenimarina TaxID=400390 RepID=A0ABT9GZE0_9GAMM|nr:PEP-CTERM sorting domain-containing protein [Alkalimonas collagenimarina]MDP4536412.1 PEP-CTERM sorting domain-containing protein [Alkalimonas collagenimarina]
MKKIVFTLMLFCFASLYSQPSAHAAPILTQDIIVEDDGMFFLAGSVSVNVADSFELFDSVFSADSWLSFDLFGFQFEQGMDDLFVADFDIDNLMAGFEFLQFDVLDLDSGWAFQGIFSFGSGFIDVFSAPNETLVAFFENAFLGEVSVAVPAPATISLMLLALFGLMLRQRAIS